MLRFPAILLVAAAAAVAAPLGGAPPLGEPPLGGEPVTPLRPVDDLDAAKVELGLKLFHDPRLSRGDAVACASCHRLDAGGDDDRARAPGADGRPLDYNAPTIFNVALNFRLNWRGNFATLEQQNEAVLLDARVMNTSWLELLPKLQADASYPREFSRLYGGAPSRERVLDALATFQRSLTTPNSRLDRYLRGENALSPAEEQGYRLFQSYGCIACHQGANLGGNLFQRVGIFRDLFPQAAATEADLGRFAITGMEADRKVFRVPGLRNVAVTAPYFHNGYTGSLAEAVEIMARSQLGRELPPQDVDLIVQFLNALTGEYQGRSLSDRRRP
jgi:cytochrome c peroxidase